MVLGAKNCGYRVENKMKQKNFTNFYQSTFSVKI